MSIRSYRDLEAWQRSVELVTAIYELTRAFPKHELYGLTSQIQRAAISIPSNIAEGHDRDSTREYLHHLAYSLGSLAELETLLVITERLDYASGQPVQSLTEQCRSIGRMLRALQRSLRLRLNTSET